MLKCDMQCVVCNSDEYMKMTRGDMERLLRERGFLSDQAGSGQDAATWEEEESCAPVTPTPHPRYTPQCRWAPLSHLDPCTLTFPGGAVLQLHSVPPTLLPRIQQFYICTGCGKVFWEGSHFSRVISQFQEVLRVSEDEVDGEWKETLYRNMGTSSTTSTAMQNMY